MLVLATCPCNWVHVSSSFPTTGLLCRNGNYRCVFLLLLMFLAQKKTLLTLPCLCWLRWILLVLLPSFFLISWQWLFTWDFLEKSAIPIFLPLFSSYYVHSNWNKQWYFSMFPVWYFWGRSGFHDFSLRWWQIQRCFFLFCFCFSVCCCTITTNGIAGNTTIFTATKRTFSVTLCSSLRGC